MSLGLWGNVVAKNMRVKGTNFETLGFGFELPADLIGSIFAVRVMRVEYDHYSKMCKSNRIPPRAAKDIPSYYDHIEQRIRRMEEDVVQKREERRALREAFEEQQRAMEETDRERQRLHMLERKSKKKGGMVPGPGGKGGTGATQLSEAEEQLAERTQQLQKQQAELIRQEKRMMGVVDLDDIDEEGVDEGQAAKDGGQGGGGGEATVEKKEKDPQLAVKELLQERLDLYRIEIEENELNLRSVKLTITAGRLICIFC